MKRLLSLAIVWCVCAAGCFAATAGVPASEKKGMSLVELSSIREFGKNELVKKTPLQTDKVAYLTYFLAPRQILPLHAHPGSDEIFYVVEGLGQFTVGSDQKVVSAGTTVYGPADVTHAIVNSGRQDMVVISVQAPTPVQMKYAENASVACAVCGQEMVIPVTAKVGDILVCPRCQAKMKLSKSKTGTWVATHI